MVHPCLLVPVKFLVYFNIAFGFGLIYQYREKGEELTNVARYQIGAGCATIVLGVLLEFGVMKKSRRLVLSYLILSTIGFAICCLFFILALIYYTIDNRTTIMCIFVITVIWLLQFGVYQYYKACWPKDSTNPFLILDDRKEVATESPEVNVVK